MSISRWNPYPLWDVAGIQNWLEEMGREGYALGEWNSFWSIGKVPFYQDPSAAGARYRLEPLGRIRERRKEDWERRQGYAAQGWHYVTTIHRMYEVFRCDDPEVPDLYTDTQSLSWAMKRLGRWQWLMVLLWLVWAVLVLWDSLSYLVTDPYLLLSRLVLESDCPDPGLCVPASAGRIPAGPGHLSDHPDPPPAALSGYGDFPRSPAPHLSRAAAAGPDVSSVGRHPCLRRCHLCKRKSGRRRAGAHRPVDLPPCPLVGNRSAGGRLLHLRRPKARSPGHL